MSVAVSVVVPIYNVEKYLTECLESLKSQDFDDYEVIMVNDDSTDGSRGICETYLENKNFKLINQENRGLSGARNTGISHATGKYLTFVDSDDYVMPDYCSSMYGLMEEHDLDVCAAAFRIVKESQKGIFHLGEGEHLFNDECVGRILTKAEFFNIYVEKGGILIAAWNKMFRTSIFKHNNITFPEGWLYEDNITTLEAYKHSNKFYLLNKITYVYKQKSSSITGNACLKPKNVNHCFTQSISALRALFEMSNIPDSCKEKGKTAFSDGLTLMFLNYQREAVVSFAVAEERTRNFVIFGASPLCAEYIEIFKLNGNEVSVVDNDTNKTGMQFNGAQILHFDDLHTRGICNQTILIATFRFFLPIYRQLFENGFVNSFADVMPYEGKTAVEKEYIIGFKKLYDFWYSS